MQTLIGAVRKFWWSVEAHFLAGQGNAVDGTGGSGGVVDNCHSHRLRRYPPPHEPNSAARNHVEARRGLCARH